jgi:hypothetical protein
MSRQDKERTKLPDDFEEYRKRPDVQRHRAVAAELHRTAAFDDRETRSENAGKSDFQQKLARAESYLPSTKPRTEEDKRAAQDFMRYLRKEWFSGRPAGPGRPWRKKIEQRDGIVLIPQAVIEEAAVDAIAQLVREGQEVWRKENNSPRVPRPKTEELVKHFTEQTVRGWKIPPAIASKLPRLVHKHRDQKKK